MDSRNYYIHSSIDKPSVAPFNMINGINSNNIILVYKQDIETPRSPFSNISVSSSPSSIPDEHNIQQNQINSQYNDDIPKQTAESLFSGITGSTNEAYIPFSNYMDNDQKYISTDVDNNKSRFIGGSETNLLFNNQNTTLKIRVEGILETGAKSRVETQSKLCIKLLSEHDSKVSNWSYLRIHESMLARSKLRKSQQQKLLDGSAAAMVSDETKVLDLKATVICESDETKRIKMCQGCVRRERKRAERKKDAKPSSHDLSMNPHSDAVDEAFERDRLRILLFNCEPLVNFSTGDAILPTRITCYCRHHNERVGFRIRFTMINHLGVVVAAGDSPPIMITDDHKSSKTRITSCKRRRGEFDLVLEDNALTTPVSSRPGSCCSSTPGEYTPLETPFSNHSDKNLEYFSRSRTPSDNSYSSASALHHFNSPLLTPREDEVISTDSHLHTPGGSWNEMVNPYRNVQYPILDISCMCQNHMTASEFPYPMIVHNDAGVMASPSSRRRRIEATSPLSVSQSQQHIVSPHFQTLPKSSPLSSPQIRSPMTVYLERIVPSQGPTHGGIEVTVVGNGFHQGFTLMFGDRPTTTIRWSPSSIVCVLPPSENTDPVVVSFKEHPMSNNEVPLFNYYNSSNKELLELSLQAVGLNNSGHFEEARKTALSLLQDSRNQGNISLQRNQVASNQKRDYNQASDFEYEVINMLSRIGDASAFELTNVGGQNVLHLAAHLSCYLLVSYILTRYPGLVNVQDRNGLTPLHFGCLSKATHVVETLMNSGASISLQSNFGTPMDLVSRSIQPYQYSMENEFFNLTFSLMSEALRGADNPLSWLPRQFIYAATQFQQRKDLTTVSSIDLYPENPLLIQDQSITVLYSI